MIIMIIIIIIIIIIQNRSITHLSDLQIKRESKLLLKRESSIDHVIENENNFLLIFNSYFKKQEQYDDDDDDDSSIDSYEYKKDMESDTESNDAEEYFTWQEAYDLICEYEEYESLHASEI